MEMNVFGRTMFENGNEIPCQTIRISPDTIEVQCAGKPKKNEKVIFYIDEIGRIEGEVKNVMNDKFNANVIATDSRKEKLFKKMKWVKLNQKNKVEDKRKDKRIMPRQPYWEMKIEQTNQKMNVQIIDISLSGAFVECQKALRVGTRVILGGIKGRVVRKDEKGVAIEFITTELYQRRNLKARLNEKLND